MALVEFDGEEEHRDFGSVRRLDTNKWSVELLCPVCKSNHQYVIFTESLDGYNGTLQCQKDHMEGFSFKIDFPKGQASENVMNLPVHVVPLQNNRIDVYTVCPNCNEIHCYEMDVNKRNTTIQLHCSNEPKQRFVALVADHRLKDIQRIASRAVRTRNFKPSAIPSSLEAWCRGDSDVREGKSGNPSVGRNPNDPSTYRS